MTRSTCAQKSENRPLERYRGRLNTPGFCAPVFFTMWILVPPTPHRSHQLHLPPGSRHNRSFYPFYLLLQLKFHDFSVTLLFQSSPPQVKPTNFPLEVQHSWDSLSSWIFSWESNIVAVAWIKHYRNLHRNCQDGDEERVIFQTSNFLSEKLVLSCVSIE